MSLFLTADELHDLTGYQRPSAQIRWLSDQQWLFYVARAGRPVVHREYYETRMRAKAVSESERDKRISCADLAQLTMQHIIEVRREAYRVSGVYFLFKGDDLLYIGQSKNLMRRLGDHASQINFDSYAIFPCPSEDLDHTERSLILKFLPPLNSETEMVKRNA